MKIHEIKNKKKMIFIGFLSCISMFMIIYFHILYNVFWLNFNPRNYDCMEYFLVFFFGNILYAMLSITVSLIVCVFPDAVFTLLVSYYLSFKISNKACIIFCICVFIKVHMSFALLFQIIGMCIIFSIDMCIFIQNNLEEHCFLLALAFLLFAYRNKPFTVGDLIIIWLVIMLQKK